MSDWYMWPIAAASLIGTIANVYHRRWCFYIWALCNVAWTIYDIHKTAYPQAALMAVYFGLALWGLYKWRKQP